MLFKQRKYLLVFWYFLVLFRLKMCHNKLYFGDLGIGMSKRIDDLIRKEKIKEERLKIATKVIGGLIANEGDSHRHIVQNVTFAYEVADEMLKQGGYFGE
jgi:hypothetical protein